MVAFKTTVAQTLEYVENKGQWDSKVKFKSEIGGSIFFLQQQGYKVLLHSKEDLEKLEIAYSGHIHSGGGTGQISSTHIDNSTAPSLPADGTPNSSHPIILHSHAYEVNFIGSSANATIVPDKPLNTYNNYYIGNDRSKWMSHCKTFQAVTYQNIYPGVDARYYTGNGAIKYDLIIHPGADVSKIALQFNGADALSIKKGNLIVKTSLGKISELKPYSYQLGAKGRIDVDAKYVIGGNTVRFKLGNYDKSATLIIDPTLIFASFTGSKADNWGYTATYDRSGNFYLGGIAFANGYPVSTGAFQQSFGGGGGEQYLEPYDAAIIKLSSNGSQRLYATYLGGSGNEQPHSMVVDNENNLIIAGRSSSENFPNPYGVKPAGGFDIFITKLSADGSTLIGSRTIGGSAHDGLNIRGKYDLPGDRKFSISRNYGDDARSEVIVDGANNIYLASSTQSSNFPVTSNAFQKTFGGGLQDGVLIKASPDLSQILFSSFLGGNGSDAAFVLALNPLNNNIYVGGATSSTDLKGTGGSTGLILHNTFQGGESDGFVSIVENGSSTLTLTKACYVGSTGNDMLYGIQLDKVGFPYITGTTTTALPIVGNIAFKTYPNGKQYIAKMKSDLSDVVYSTNFGKISNPSAVPDISITALLVDRCENVYVAGWGGGLDTRLGYPNATTKDLPVTPNAIRSSTDGSDFYFFVLEKNASSQLYGTFFGAIDNGPNIADHVDGGTSRFDKEGVIYEAICADCGKVSQKGSPFPTTPGVWAPQNGATMPAYCNEAAVKIAFELAGVGSAIQSSINGVKGDTSGCVPLTVFFKDTIGTGKKFIWSFGDGTADTTTYANVPNGKSVTHTFNKLGTFRVRLISIDSMSCNIADTSYANIKVRDDQAYIGFTTTKLSPCDSLKYQFNNTSTAPANKPFTRQSFQWSFGDGATLVTSQSAVTHSYAAPGTYFVTLSLIDTAYCNSPDSTTGTLRIAANVKAQFETPSAGCAPYIAVTNNTSPAGRQFFWDFGDGTTSTDESPAHLYNFTGTYVIKLIATDPSTCNKIDSTYKTIIVSGKPTATFTYRPATPKENTPFEFVNLSTGATLYKWIFGDGDSVVTRNRDTVVSHIYNATGTYNVLLIAYNIYGCTDTAYQQAQTIINPLADVPNAFTPNGDGINDFVTVKGFGIQKMDWRIYNRWGQMVYQSGSTGLGWDGRYQGALQPQEVYAYVLSITFSDGTTYRKKGDITLLR